MEAQARKKLARDFLDISSNTAELGVLRESLPPPSVAGEEDFDMKFPDHSA